MKQTARTHRDNHDGSAMGHPQPLQWQKHVWKLSLWGIEHVLVKRFYWKRLVGIPRMRGRVTLACETCLVCQLSVTLSTALNLVHRNSFPKLSYFTQLCKFPGKASFEKHADPEKKNRNRRKSRANSRNLQEPLLRSRKEESLYGHCAMKNARRMPEEFCQKALHCWGVAGFGKKASFSKEFR